MGNCLTWVVIIIALTFAFLIAVPLLVIGVVAWAVILMAALIA